MTIEEILDTLEESVIALANKEKAATDLWHQALALSLERTDEYEKMEKLEDKLDSVQDRIQEILNKTNLY